MTSTRPARSRRRIQRAMRVQMPQVPSKRRTSSGSMPKLYPLGREKPPGPAMAHEALDDEQACCDGEDHPDMDAHRIRPPLHRHVHQPRGEEDEPQTYVEDEKRAHGFIAITRAPVGLLECKVEGRRGGGAPLSNQTASSVPACRSRRRAPAPA